MPQLTLSLVIHNHQPVGNFDHVFAEATAKAYRPMLEALERHPNIRLALHYSGSLLDWLGSNQREHIACLDRLVRRNQVELLSGGYYEPILVAIPEEDRAGQLRKMNQYLRQRFGVVPSGAWVAERVWEPHLPKALAQAGIDYTVLDDTPFKMSGLGDDDLFGPYVTEEQGAALKVFGNVMHLRYAIPWHPVQSVIDWLRQQAEAHPCGVAVSADDGEKFGLWPDTWDHCWGDDGWLDRFFCALEENSDWLVTRPLGEVAARVRPLGRVYLPCAAYEEMMHWALPPDAFRRLASVRQELQAGDRGDVLRFVHGASWRSFLSRYDEVNHMHKRMVRISQKVHDLPEGERKDQALDHTWAAQCNCGYWHGLFGGIYLFHIRVSNYAQLIAAETLVDRALSQTDTWARAERGDLDADTEEEIILNTDKQVLVFKPSYGGSLVEWDWRDRRYNLLNTMTRRPEGYHESLRQAAEQGRLFLPGDPEIPGGVKVQKRDIHTCLFYDRHRRVALMDHFLHADTTPESFYQARYSEEGDFTGEPYQATVEESDDQAMLVMRRESTVSVGQVAFPVQVEKRACVLAGSGSLQVHYRVTNLDDIPADLRFGVEFNWGIVGGNSNHAYLKVGSEERRLNDLAGDDDVSGFTIGSSLPVLAGEVRVIPSRPTSLWHFPLEVVSNSEAGYECAYQGTCTLLWWAMHLEPRRPWEVELKLDLRESKP